MGKRTEHTLPKTAYTQLLTISCQQCAHKTEGTHDLNVQLHHNEAALKSTQSDAARPMGTAEFQVLTHVGTWGCRAHGQGTWYVATLESPMQRYSPMRRNKHRKQQSSLVSYQFPAGLREIPEHTGGIW